jgi:hypothetical protein
MPICRVRKGDYRRSDLVWCRKLCPGISLILIVLDAFKRISNQLRQPTGKCIPRVHETLANRRYSVLAFDQHDVASHPPDGPI